jgi:hypothetical protein
MEPGWTLLILSSGQGYFESASCHKVIHPMEPVIYNVCNNADSGSLVNFTPFIMDGDINPDWLDVDNSGAVRIGGNMFDFDGVIPGLIRLELLLTIQSHPVARNPMILKLQSGIVAVPPWFYPLMM